MTKKQIKANTEAAKAKVAQYDPTGKHALKAGEPVVRLSSGGTFYGNPTILPTHQKGFRDGTVRVEIFFDLKNGQDVSLLTEITKLIESKQT